MPTRWWVWPDGVNDNGAGFDASLGGVNYASRATPILTVADGSCNVGNTTITSATGGFTAQMVGNVIGITQGGSFRGYRQILAFTNTNTVTVDQNGPVTAANCTLKVGGASKVDQSGFPFIQSFTAFVPGNKIWIKGPGLVAGDYQPIVNEPTLSVNGTFALPCVAEGYTTTEGDGGRPTFVNNAGALTALTISGNFWIVKNLNCRQINGTFAAIRITGPYGTLVNCVGQGGTPISIANGSIHLRECEAKNSAATAACVLIVGSGNVRLDGCEIHGSTTDGINNGNAGPNTFANCRIYGNTLCGIYYPTGLTGGAVVHNCDIWNNGLDNIRIDANTATGPLFNTHIERNILGKAPNGYDINYNVSDLSAIGVITDFVQACLECNAFYSTGLGRTRNLPANSTDIVLTASPFASDTDFTLNAAAGGGLVIRQTPCGATQPDGNTLSRTVGASEAPTSPAADFATNLWRELTNEPDLTVPDPDTVFLYIDAGAEALNRRIRYYWKTDSTSVVLVAGTQEYALPADVVEIRWVEWRGRPLPKGAIEEWRTRGDDWRNEPAGEPQEWAFYGNKLVFRPQPSAEAIAQAPSPVFRYCAKPPSVGVVGFDQLNEQDWRVVVYFGVAEWSASYPDSAVAQGRVAYYKERFDQEVQAIAQDYSDRGLSR